MTTGVHPIILIGVLGLLGAVAAIVLACRTSSWLRRSLLIFLALLLSAPAAWVGVTLHPELVDSRYRTYKALYKEIKVGMTRTEVMQLIDQHYPAEGKRARPKISEDDATYLGMFMDPEKSAEPNCEGIFLTMRDGKVIKKEYLPD